MTNSKLKISEFEKYSLSTKSQTLIKGGIPDGWSNPYNLEEDNGDFPGDDPTNPGGPGGSGMISTNIKIITGGQSDPVYPTKP